MDYEPRNTVSSEDSVENALKDSSKQASNETITQIVTTLFFVCFEGQGCLYVGKKKKCLILPVIINIISVKEVHFLFFLSYMIVIS